MTVAVSALRRHIMSLDNGAWGAEPDGGEYERVCIRAADFDYSSLRARSETAPRRSFDAQTVQRLTLARGDIVLEKSGGGEEKPVGRAVLYDSEEAAICTNFAARLRPAAHVDPRFMVYLLAHLYSVGVTARCINQTTGIQNLNTALWLAEPVQMPERAEQRQIADFLDDQVARIDRAVAARQQQQQLAGLSRNVWISSEMEEQGRANGMLALRYGLTRISQGWSPQCDEVEPTDGEWGVLRAGAVNGGIFRPDDRKRLPSEVAPRPEYEVHAGDLLMNRASGSVDLIGSAAVVGRDVRPRTLLCDKIYRLELTGRWDAGYIAAIWRSQQVRESIKLGVSGAEGMANSLPGSVVSSILLPQISTSEQAAFLALLDRRETVAVRLSGAVQRSVNLLNEYKRSLITAAVTGEFDVSTASGRGIPA